MTRVRARNVKCYAKTDDQQSILTIDGYGKINVIIIDNLNHALDTLLLTTSKQLPIENIINANIVYSLASQLNLRVGIFKDADSVILDYLNKHISNDIVEEDKAIVIEELKASWQSLRQHTLAKRYVLCGAHEPVDGFYINPAFAAFGSYEIFIKDYLYSLTRVIIQKSSALSPDFMLLIDLVQRSLQAKNYFPNRFLQLEHVISSLRWRCEVENFEGIATCRVRLENQVAHLKGLWCDRVKGTILHDLDDIEKDFPQDAGLMLAQIIATGTCATQSKDLALYMAPLIQYLSTPNAFAQSVKFESKDYEEPYVLFQEAIHYAIVYIAQHYGLMLKPFMDVPCYFWAGKGIDKEELLLEDLKREGAMSSLKPFELQALEQFSKHEALLSLVQNEKLRREHMTLVIGIAALTMNPLPSPILFRHRNVHHPFQLMSMHVARQQEEVLPEVIPEEENILQLTPTSTGCTLF